MKIHAIRVEGFKRFRDPLLLDALEPGINLIAAPNGQGKSTIAEAVRVAFLERHRTAALGDQLAPWSQPGATPTVQIEFERGGRRHRLAKSFGNRKSCTLEVEGGQRLTGDEAEQALAEMLSFSYAGKGTSRPENQGVPGLLWVQQGSAWRVADPVEHAHDYIRRALGDDLGELAATAGDRVVERVQAELAQWVTVKSGKPTGELARAMERLAARQVTLQELQRNVAAYESAVDRYAQLQAQHAAGERDRPWRRQRAQAEAAREALQALERLEGRRRQLEMERQVAAAEIERHRQALAAFDEEDRALQARRAEEAAAGERDRQTLARVQAAEAALRSAQEAERRARAAAAVARRAAARRSRQEALAAAQRRQQELQARLQVVEGHHRELGQREAELARLAGFAGAGRKLQAAEAAVAQASARLEAVSTRIEYELDAGGVRLAGAPLAGAGSVTVAEPTEITIAGVGRLRVLPGARDLSQLKAEAERAGAGLETLLQGLGVTAPDEARRGEEALAAARADVERLGALVAGLAPAGVQALRSESTAATGEAERHAQALAALPQDDEEALGLEAAEAAEALAQQALLDAQQAHEAARADATRAQEQARLARQELHAAEARVAAPDREERRRATQSAVVAAQAQLQVRHDEAAAVAAEIEQAHPEQLRDDIQRLTNSANALEAAHGRLGAELNQLAGALQAQGALGLQEEAAAVADEVARLQRQVADYQRRAGALSHLLQLLLEKREGVARGIRAPLQKHMNRYLALQFPGASLELDERLKPHRISRPGPFGAESGGFDDLSGGEREQLGIIARLAYADLLKEAGKPTLLILDDSLVNSDARRLDTMKRVIWDAAKRHQILIFTCHGEHWQDIGVAARTLQ